ncbi:alpha-ketoglutarate-dependent dioxygenase alkb homolog 7, mitochondrial-like protein [Plakobranchus ocellatus]|uniref:Alpha-ketoglutarate-dependent dioxygenase alkb homolog 7, mitochondrial-like protein n=1 Tax=Plakobranchus ocellatus TaxID=259542 RepID=A0AAV3YCP8_9GAST|nr:alpha-ketoglutarate-dependent dioxygenase alkb homolog 7, mitochondrial-like protein [Plakobranchus ocellatus]
MDTSVEEMEKLFSTRNQTYPNMMEAYHNLSKLLSELFRRSRHVSIVSRSVGNPTLRDTSYGIIDKLSFTAGPRKSPVIHQTPAVPINKNQRYYHSDGTKSYRKSIGSLLCRRLERLKHMSYGKQSALLLNRCYSTVQEKSNSDKLYLDAKDPKLWEILSEDMIVKTDFLNEKEEEALFIEVEKYMKRLRYEFDHWDNAIHGYRETEKKEWNDENMKVLNRVKDLAFTPSVAPLAYVHVLDIAKEGYIKPHVDAVRFCGDTITGMCLLSSCVMRLALESDSTNYADVYLPRRSLYIMRGRARYDFTHEVLKDDQSYFKAIWASRLPSTPPTLITAFQTGIVFIYSQIHNKVISGFQALSQARVSVAGLEPVTQRSLQVSGRIG